MNNRMNSVFWVNVMAISFVFTAFVDTCTQNFCRKQQLPAANNLRKLEKLFLKGLTMYKLCAQIVRTNTCIGPMLRLHASDLL